MKKQLLINKNKCTVVYKPTHDQDILQREIDLIKTGLIQNLLPFDVVKKGKQTYLQWHTDGYVLLTDYFRLDNYMDKKLLVRLLVQLVEMYKSMQKYSLSIEKMITEIDKVFVRPSSRELKFIFLPVEMYGGSGDLKEFIADILQTVHYSPYEDQVYINDFLEILNGCVGFDYKEIERFSESLTNIITEKKHKNNNYEKKRCSFCGALIESSCLFCSVCGGRIEGKRSCPFIVRNSRRERVCIDNFPFNIGKSLENDCVINDNPLISRRHARIEKDGSKYYIIDLKSTNGSFIEKKRIPSDIKVEIFDGDVFSLADEVFTFYSF